MTISSIILVAVPSALTAALGVWAAWAWHKRFRNCCPLPGNGRLWVCGHRKAWHKARNGLWFRVSRRKYVRQGMAELTREIRKVTSDGR